jgi:hypothetical protein
MTSFLTFCERAQEGGLSLFVYIICIFTFIHLNLSMIINLPVADGYCQVT